MRNMRRQFALLFWLFCVVAMPARALEVYVLIDTSSSTQGATTKVNAFVRTLTQALPEGSIITAAHFDDLTETTLAPTRVTPDHRASIAAALQTETSNRDGSDIENAIEYALSHMQLLASDDEQHLFIISDGFVQIDAARLINIDSADRIEHHFLPLLQQKQVTIHPVALTELYNGPLLKTLAKQTDGLFIHDLEGLSDRLAVLFNSGVSANIPVRKKTFTLDDDGFAVVEVDSSGQEIVLKTPKGQRYEFSQQSYHDATFTAGNPGYLVLENFPKGQYSLIGNFPANHEPKVYQNFSMLVDDLPDDVLMSEHVPLTARIQASSPLSDEIKAFINFEAELNNEIYSLNDDGVNGDQDKGDGVFTFDVPVHNLEGEHNITVRASFPWLTLSDSQTFEVHNQVAIMKTGYYPDFDMPRYEIGIELNEEVIVPGSTKVSALIVDDDGGERTETLPAGKMTFAIPTSRSHNYYDVVVHLTGQTIADRPFKAELTPVHLPYVPVYYPFTYKGPSPEFIQEILDLTLSEIPKGSIFDQIQVKWREYVPKRHPWVQPPKVEIALPELTPVGEPTKDTAEQTVVIPDELLLEEEVLEEEEESAPEEDLSPVNWIIVFILFVVFNAGLVVAAWLGIQTYRKKYHIETLAEPEGEAPAADETAVEEEKADE